MGTLFFIVFVLFCLFTVGFSFFLMFDSKEDPNSEKIHVKRIEVDKNNV